jgi:hypothetical protein
MFRVVACALHALWHQPGGGSYKVRVARCHGVMAGLLKHILRHLIRQCLVLILVGHIGQVARPDQRVVTVAPACYLRQTHRRLVDIAGSGYTTSISGCTTGLHWDSEASSSPRTDLEVGR